MSLYFDNMIKELLNGMVKRLISGQFYRHTDFFNVRRYGHLFFCFYNYEHVDKHHEKYTVSEIHSCYDGKYKICDITIKSRSGDTTRLEVEFLVEEMQTVYKYCWYRGVERTGRWCNASVNETLSNNYTLDYKDM